jgi:hypothetical protein
MCKQRSCRSRIIVMSYLQLAELVNTIGFLLKVHCTATAGKDSLLLAHLVWLGCVGELAEGWSVGAGQGAALHNKRLRAHLHTARCI